MLHCTVYQDSHWSPDINPNSIKLRMIFDLIEAFLLTSALTMENNLALAWTKEILPGASQLLIFENNLYNKELKRHCRELCAV